ncbi:MAG: glycine cleavage system protein GcvH [Actinomycetota bacterium]|nr:glycine cleavage system protein GcvH [Actinomycetota bacterium]
MQELPDDRKYHREHMWIKEDGKTGITYYAQDQLGDIVYLEVSDPGTEVESGEAFGEIESRKAVSDLYSPVSGTIKEVNSEVVDAPEIINEDPYEKGWIAIIEMSDASELDNLLTSTEYKELVAGDEG